MSQRDMQHQVTGDGGASATDVYRPAGDTPHPATRLPDLPPTLLDDIACRVMQLGARSLLPLTCRAFSQAHLLHVPALRIQLGRQCCDELLTPRVVAALQARTSKLTLTLEQPETVDSMCFTEQLAPTLQLPQTEYTQHYTELLAHALAKLDNCAAVEVCKLHLLDSFPSLTSLTLEGLCVPSDALASLLSHPPLAMQLQQLNLTNTYITVGDESGAVGPVFQGLQLKQLSIAAESTPLLPSFLPLKQHLTQLHLCCGSRHYGLGNFREYLQPLAQLQVLTLLSGYSTLDGLAELLQALPLLHTLQLPFVTVRGQQQLDTLLAATQITSLQLATVKALDASYADAPCSWQRLELTRETKWTTIAYLPLHSLSQPLVLGVLQISVQDIPNLQVAAALHILEKQDISVWDIPNPEVAAAFNLVAQACKHSYSSRREDLAQLVALLQPLQRCCVGKVEVHDLHGVTTADILELAPLCRDCTHFVFQGGSIEPSLEFWRQLVLLMPAVQKVEFRDIQE
ncbi:hypothetical protein QJQ45_010929, partial [Haematococcus lacustris]